MTTTERPTTALLRAHVGHVLGVLPDGLLVCDTCESEIEVKDDHYLGDDCTEEDGEHLAALPDEPTAPTLDAKRLGRAIESAWDSEIHQPLHSLAQGGGYFQLRPAPGLAPRVAAQYARLAAEPDGEGT